MSQLTNPTNQKTNLHLTSRHTSVEKERGYQKQIDVTSTLIHKPPEKSQ